MHLTQDGWIAKYAEKQALWFHDGNPAHPHALLTSGKHSDGFFNSGLVIADETLLGYAASDLISLFGEQGGGLSQVNGVVGPQTGATKLAELLKGRINFTTGLVSCFSSSPAKHEEGGRKSMLFTSDESAQLQGQSILLCEDVLSTGGSIDLTVEAIVRAGGKPLPYVLVLVNRSGLTEVNGRKIIALINKPMPMWDPADCPLCPKSEAIRPKRENWALLNAVD